jgi:hypothetical protein
MVVGRLLEELILSAFLGLGGKRRDLLGNRNIRLVQGRTIGSDHHDVLEVGTAGCIGINPFLDGASFQFVECE